MHDMNHKIDRHNDDEQCASSAPALNARMSARSRTRGTVGGEEVTAT
jgi:hypothetical protein